MSFENPGKFSEKDKINKKELLKRLALDIARKYGMDTKKAEKLIKSKVLESIDSLKSEIKNKEILKNIEEKELEKLFFTLKGALDVVEDTSKLKIEVLKSEIEKLKSSLEKFLNPKLLEKAKNPKLVHEHILGIALGSANSIFTTTEALYKIGKGIIKTPYDLYILVSGKGKIKDIDKV